MDLEVGQTFRRVRWALVLVPLVMAACGSGSGGPGTSAHSQPSSDTRLKLGGVTVLTQIASYQMTVKRCTSQANPVVCLEAADRGLGGQIHSYANVLAVGRGFTAPQAVLSTARNNAQTLANSLEILGDAQPTQANYNQVLNTFDVGAAISQLQSAVRKVDDTLGR